MPKSYKKKISTQEGRNEYLKIAEKFQQSGEFEKAISYFTLGLTLEPNKKNLYYNIYFILLGKFY